MSFQTEEEVLLRWRDLVLETDPDIIIGYNTSNFDLPYLINRAAALKLNKFPYWGRMRNKCGLPLCALTPMHVDLSQYARALTISQISCALINHSHTSQSNF